MGPAPLPLDVRVRLTRLSRRLAAGVFLDAWMPSAIVALLAAGVLAIAVRIFVPSAAGSLRWLWLAPALALVPAAIVGWRRAFSTADVIAIADRLAGGSGVLIAVSETDDEAWTTSPALMRGATFALPRIRPWRRAPALGGAAVFLGIALLLPQRAPRPQTRAVAEDIANSLQAAVVEMKQQRLVTPDEEQALDEAIERVRRGAEQRVDASSWEAADAVREKLAADVAEKQNAVKWAEAALARFEAAAKDGGSGAPGMEASAAELSRALDRLAQSGLLAGAPEDLKALLKSGKLPRDAAALRELSASLAKYLRDTNGRIGAAGKLAKEFGRFNPGDFPLGEGADGGEQPGQGGISRGRADAELTWGKETAPFDRFKAKPLPPGAARSPDDWAPVVELPGAPQAAPQASERAAAREYNAAAGQAAWRRGLAPRHQSAVKKYFAK